VIAHTLALTGQWKVTANFGKLMFHELKMRGGQGFLPCASRIFWCGKLDGVFHNVESSRRQRAHARHTCPGGYVTVAKCATAILGNDRCFDLSYRADCSGQPRSAREHFYFSAEASQTTPDSLEQCPNLTLPIIPRIARKTRARTCKKARALSLRRCCSTMPLH